MTPRGLGKSGLERKFAFDRASITNTKSWTFDDLCLQDNQNYVELNQKCLKRSSDQNNEDSHIIVEKAVWRKANSIMQLNPTNTIVVEDDNKETESNIQLPKFKQNQKECVINKAILRSVRRVFLNIFKEQNKRLIKRRFWNVQSSQFLYTLWNLVNKWILPTLKSDMISSDEGHTSLKYSFSLSELNEYEKDPTNLAIFLFRFIGIKPKDKMKYSDEIEVKGQQMQQCMYKYSLLKLKELIKTLEFRILFQYAYFNHFDSILDSECLLEDKYEEYMSATSKLNEEVMKISNKHEIS